MEMFVVCNDISKTAIQKTPSFEDVFLIKQINFTFMNKILSDLFQNYAFRSLMDLILVLPAFELQHQAVIVHDSVNTLAKSKDLTFHP